MGGIEEQEGQCAGKRGGQDAQRCRQAGMPGNEGERGERHGAKRAGQAVHSVGHVHRVDHRQGGDDGEQVAERTEQQRALVEQVAEAADFVVAEPDHDPCSDDLCNQLVDCTQFKDVIQQANQNQKACRGKQGV